MKDYKISGSRYTELAKFCKDAEIRIGSFELLDLAFHHRSYSNESQQFRYKNNERLEFLGDSVLGMITADFLYNDMDESKEGDLAKIKANVVSEQVLSEIALNKLHLNKYLVLGKGEENSGGRTKKAILADAMEAVIGAVYLDSGFKAAREFVLRFIVPEIKKVQGNRGNKDYKSLLQEYYQKLTKKSPVYHLEYTKGPEHEKEFFVTVSLNGTVYGPAVGKSKKDAEQKIARETCIFLNVIDEK